MTGKRTAWIVLWGSFSALLVASAGCGGGSSTGDPGGGNGGNGGHGGGGTSDEAYCKAACESFASCGVAGSVEECTTSCLSDAAAAFLACLKESPSDCNSAALCTYEPACRPKGSASCQATQECGATCLAMQADASCYCACGAAESPDVAIDAWRFGVCWTTHCFTECTTDVNACGACVNTHCPGEDAQCD